MIESEAKYDDSFQKSEAETASTEPDEQQPLKTNRVKAMISANIAYAILFCYMSGVKYSVNEKGVNPLDLVFMDGLLTLTLSPLIVYFMKASFYI